MLSPQWVPVENVCQIEPEIILPLLKFLSAYHIILSYLANPAINLYQQLLNMLSVALQWSQNPS